MDVIRERPLEGARQVEETHWWFVTLRELVAQTVTSRHLPGSKVLDAGCGAVGVLGAIPDTYERVGARLDTAELLELPFDDGHFDAAWSLDVLSDARIPDDRAALRELRRVVRTGGTLILNVPTSQGVFSAAGGGAAPARRYSAGQASELLADAGFIPKWIGYRGTCVLPFVVASQLIGRRPEATEIQRPPELVNRLLTSIGRWENQRARYGKLPFGLSVYAVNRAH
jgi:SAM-dependent methyltransferase